MKLGIVGLPHAGKTTVFNAVAGAHESVGGYAQPDEIHRAIVKIPDVRLDNLCEFMHSAKRIPAEIEFLDFPPPAKTERGTENVFPTSLRECEGIVAVINCFDLSLTTPPLERLKDLQNEMILADLLVAEKRREKLEKNSSRGVKIDAVELAGLKKSIQWLESEKPLRSLEFTESEYFPLRGFAFLSRKPLMIVLNLGEGQELNQDLVRGIQQDPLFSQNVAVTGLCGSIEMEVAALEEGDRDTFLSDFGITEPAAKKLIRMSYDLLDLITFFTGAEKESRAWPITRGTSALNAAGEIHQDIKRGFIRAEVVNVDKLIELGGNAACRKAGVARLEGKEYAVLDGDYILFRFNV